jgi:hypothetical protein
MANRIDFKSAGRDFVSLALDRIAERVINAENLPDSVKGLGNKWQTMSPAERNEFAGHVTDGLQTALAAVPVIVAAAVSKYKSPKKSKSEADADDDSESKKDKKDKKRKKKNKKR